MSSSETTAKPIGKSTKNGKAPKPKSICEDAPEGRVIIEDVPGGETRRVPNDCEILENAINSSSKMGSTYVPTGDSSLLPWEMLQLRNFLLSQGSDYFTMLWVITLVFIYN